MEASATARRDDAKIFLREFTRELVREINPSTKIIAFAILILAVVGALYIGFAQFNEARRGRRTIAEQQEQLVAQQQQLQRANEQLSKVIESTNRIQNTIAMGEMLRVKYGDGVCLILRLIHLRRSRRPVVRFVIPKRRPMNPEPGSEW